MYEQENVTENAVTRNTSGASENGYFDHISNAAPVSPAEPPKKAKPERKKTGVFRKVALSVSLGLCFGLFAGLGFYAVQLGTGQFSQKEEAPEQEVERDEAENTPTGSGQLAAPVGNYINYTQGDASAVVKQVMPAMVSIVNNYTSTTTFWGQTYSQNEASSGSGIIVQENDKELLIVSNNHVVEGADHLMVTFIDGTEAEAVIKGLDSEMDLAVVAVPLSSLSQETKKAITVATLGDSDTLELGEPVIAIGNALGYGQSVSGGMVSALARELTFDDGSTGYFIQTDAAINPGNSGGALLNMDGEVVGINSSKIGGTYVEGMGYAIPITTASPIIADLMERQTRTEKVEEDDRGYLGVSLQTINAQYAQVFGMPQGAYVYSVEPGSAAEAAGILYGDVIVSFDKQKVSSANDLSSTLEYYSEGETVEIKVMRVMNGQYKTVELQITLGSRS